MSRLVDLTLYVTFEQAHGLKDLLRTSPMSFPSVKKFTTSQLAIWFKDYCPNLELLVFVYDPDMSDLFIYDLDVLLDPPGEFSDGVSGMVTQAIAVKLSQGSLVKKLRIQCPYTSNADLEGLYYIDVKVPPPSCSSANSTSSIAPFASSAGTRDPQTQEGSFPSDDKDDEWLR